MSLLLDIVDSCLNHANTVDSSKAQTKTMPSLLGTSVAPLDLPASLHTRSATLHRWPLGWHCRRRRGGCRLPPACSLSPLSLLPPRPGCLIQGLPVLLGLTLRLNGLWPVRGYEYSPNVLQWRAHKPSFACVAWNSEAHAWGMHACTYAIRVLDHSARLLGMRYILPKNPRQHAGYTTQAAAVRSVRCADMVCFQLQTIFEGWFSVVRTRSSVTGWIL